MIVSNIESTSACCLLLKSKKTKEVPCGAPGQLHLHPAWVWKETFPLFLRYSALIRCEEVFSVVGYFIKLRLQILSSREFLMPSLMYLCRFFFFFLFQAVLTWYFFSQFVNDYFLLALLLRARNLSLLHTLSLSSLFHCFFFLSLCS